MSSNTQIPNLPPLFDGKTKEIMDCEVFASFPVNTFLENITIDENGDLFVTSLDEGAVYKINSKGEKEAYAKTKGKLAGILYISANTFLLNGWNSEGVPTIYLLKKDKNIIPLIHPADALFLNGMASLTNSIFLVCDAYKGCIWKYDMAANKAEVWLENSLLARADVTNPMPAANGIKIFKDTVFVSNTAKQLLIKIPLIDNKAGGPELFMDKLNLDDFAFDTEGNIYATTHIYNSVIKITQEKEVTIIGEAEQGLAGSTAVAFGKREDDKNCIYVTTNGGMSLPLPEGIQEGSVVKIKIK
ncbi:MAG: hypothetical protein WKG06_35255 [Segetibacter sp.]